jgi:hypothetical protein
MRIDDVAFDRLSFEHPADPEAVQSFFAMADIEENARRRAAGKTAIGLSPIAPGGVRVTSPPG